MSKATTDPDQEAVDMACRGFRNAVHGWCRKYTNLPLVEDKNSQERIVALPRDMAHLLNHVSHFAKQLTRKRRSLQNGLSYVQQTLWPDTRKAFSSSRSTSEQAALLQHFLAQCLRLHDGKMLLVSGECRHPGDIRLAQAKKTKKRPDKTTSQTPTTDVNNYPSQLSLQTHRPDGYTKLYNAPGGYSGYGWDEFHDPELGLKTRLLQAMQRNLKKPRRKSTSQIAEYLTEHGAQALECLLDQHETEMTVVKQEFNALRDKVVGDLKQIFLQRAPNKTVKVLFTLYDKLEKLQVGNIVLERHGDAFQVNDARGALPNGYTQQDWSHVMKLPQIATAASTSAANSASQNQRQNPASTNVSITHPGAPEASGSTKRRRVIVDDDSSDDNNEDSNVAPTLAKRKQSTLREVNRQAQKSNKATKREGSPRTIPAVQACVSGLQVKVKKVTKSPTRRSMSLTTIKTQYGVNPEALEANREELEKEKENTSRAAKADEVEANAVSIAEGESNIRSQRRILERALHRDMKDRDPKEIWDSREVLREQLMTVGNQILWEPSTMESDVSFHDDRKDSLLKSLGYFQEARELVKDQEEFRRQLNSKGTYTPADSRFFSRNLLLLAGQSHANLGITNIELATQTKRKHTYATKDPKRYLAKATEELSMASQFAESLRSRATIDRERGSNAMETLVDYLKADQLESLALRWWGTALWYQGMRKDASEKFESGASFFAAAAERIEAESVCDDNIVEALRQLGADCFYACTALVDLASQDMENLTPTGGQQEGNDIALFIRKILGNASEVSQSICTFFEKNPSADIGCDEYMDENQIMNQKAIIRYRNEIEDWWERQKNFGKRPISSDKLLPDCRQMPQQRSEIEPLGLAKLPSRVFTIRDGGGSRRKKRGKGPNPAYHKNSGNLLSAVPRRSTNLSNENYPDEARPKRYRPWGDELLPQIIDESTGRSIPKIVYPAVAPPMSPEIRALLEAPET